MNLYKFLLILVLSVLALADSSGNTTHYANETVSPKEGVSNRKERLNVFGGLSNGLLGVLGGSGGGGGSSGSSGSSSGSSSTGLSTLQHGLKGIQSIQKLVSRFQEVMKFPFAFRGVTDSMATLTGLLAAVGGGYLTYVTMVGLFGSMMDPSNTAYQHAFSAPPHQYAPPQHLQGIQGIQGIQGAAASSHIQGYNRRQENHGGLFWGSYDLGKMYQSVTNFNYPEASFKLLRIKDEACKQRAVCEFEKFLAKKGVASVILKGVSKKVTGMEKYLDAAYRGIANEDCSYAFSACPTTLGQTLLRSVGLN